MGLFDFVKAAGRAIGIGSADAAPTPEDLRKEVESHGLPVEGLDVAIEGDKVRVSGTTPSQEDKEKLILALGNIAGVAAVEEDLTAKILAESAVFYTVKKGDTLSAIAKAQYGNANKYNAIFEANKPMLKHPDKIYPGQVLRIPPLPK
ncbi:MAG TPA: peptidoglycan-binding protein LysM [Geminicoccaceae bacterium]|nr:peptidoglycan-binding protein LysM [Geminicoccus sp.]HMU49966.1 peptidoglycan-binding protein LysM [Geminicoccaceae bacterium]